MPTPLDSIAAAATAMLERVERWSAVNSGSHHVAGLDAMRTVLRADFAPLGEMEELPLGDGRVALRLRRRPDAPNRVLLGGHYDTVFGPEHSFQQTRRDGELLRGPGVADMKGGLCVLLTALTAFEAAVGPDCSLGWTVVLNPDEEIGSPWSRPLWVEEAGRHDFGLLVEPALPGGKLARARKGSGNFEVRATGRAAHAGRDPHLGRNAIRLLADFVCALDALNGQREGLVVNVGRIEGGGPLNIVPDRASAGYNVRTVVPEDELWMQEAVADLLAELNGREGLHLEVSGEFASPPKPASAASDAMIAELQQCGLALGLQLEAAATGGACDGNKLAAAGLPNIDNLGPRGGGLHSSDEHLVIASLPERAQLLCAYLLRKAGP
ncbi:MAG: hydrolase [Verrucomicrobia bacterium]|nr:hydrolase [Verrucomicrobiota bacterium]